MAKGFKWQSAEERREIRRLDKAGHSLNEIARRLGRSRPSVKLALDQGPRTLERHFDPSPARLSLAEREEIRAGLVAGETLAAIATRLTRAPSTIGREVAANGGRAAYRAHQAHRRAARCARRPKASKLASASPLRTQVEAWLEELWSPQQIARRLRHEFPDDPMMWVSHQSIYRSLFVQGRGELRAELARCLRSGRAGRRKRGHADGRGQIPHMVMITERPAEVADRAVPGHWEGDLIMGTGSSAVGTLVERSTRYVLLLHLPGDHRAETVEAAMKAAIATLPAKLARSITWDQGSEMARHREFSVATGIPIYFCDPHSPWQRGSNENTNGLLRQFMPKGTNLRALSRADLDEIERKMNGRPRETLGWLKPCEKLAELIAATG